MRSLLTLLLLLCLTAATAQGDFARYRDANAVVPSTAFSWRPELGDRSALIVALNRRLAELATEKGIPFVDYHAALRNADNGMDAELAADGVHPTQQGCAVMKALILPVVEEVPAR